MSLRSFLTMTALALSVSRSLSGPAPLPSEIASETAAKAWEGSVSVSTYLVLHGADYANPMVTADRDWLHLEARYNYESLKTGSVWLGYNFSFGEKLKVDVTPMLGGVFGNSTGPAPGYTISAEYKQFEFFTQGEYFFDAGTKEENFFYTWSELRCSPVECFHFGVVVDRTKAFGSDIEIRRGPLAGVKYREVDLTTYWLSPGSRDAAFVFAVTLSF